MDPRSKLNIYLVAVMLRVRDMGKIALLEFLRSVYNTSLYSFIHSSIMDGYAATLTLYC